MAYVSAWFIIMHLSSEKCIHPYGGWQNPWEGTFLNIWWSSTGHIRYRFVQQEGHWGYIEHTSGKIWHPNADSLDPWKNTPIKLYSSRNGGCLFAIDQAKKRIYHRNGYLVHPLGGSLSPLDLTHIALHPDTGDDAKWKFVLQSDTKKEVKVYGDDIEAFGEWRIINSLMNPTRTDTYTITFKVGLSTFTKSSIPFKWDLPVDDAKALIASKAGFSKMLSKTTSSTWEKERDQTRTIQVIPGKSVVTWQWVYGVRQWGDEILFKSNIVQASGSKVIKPCTLM